MKGNLDMENDSTKVKNNIINLANGTDNDDVVNLAQLKSYTDSHKIIFIYERVLDFILKFF